MYENERWGKPLKHNRYSRVEDKVSFDQNIERIFGKRDPKAFQSGRKTRKVFHLKSRAELDAEQEAATIERDKRKS